MCIRDSTKGNHGLVKKKYITFGIEADSLRTAKPLSLIHIFRMKFQKKCAEELLPKMAR